MQATETGSPSIQNRKLVVLVAARLRHSPDLIICRDECLVWTCQRALCLPCLLLENEDGVPIGPQRRRRGAWQMRRVLLVEDHAAFGQRAGSPYYFKVGLHIQHVGESLAEGRMILYQEYAPHLPSTSPSPLRPDRDTVFVL